MAASLLLLLAPAQIPPGMSIQHLINADDMYKVSLGDPGVCSCETPKCVGAQLPFKHAVPYRPGPGCYYYAVGGGITAIAGGHNLCHTWRADYKSCAVFPGSTDGNCSRLTDVKCSMTGTRATITGKVDRNCTKLPYEDCGTGDTCAPPPLSNHVHRRYS